MNSPRDGRLAITKSPDLRSADHKAIRAHTLALAAVFG